MYIKIIEHFNDLKKIILELILIYAFLDSHTLSVRLVWRWIKLILTELSLTELILTKLSLTELIYVWIQ
jgi:hypothetical protein